MIEGEVTTQHIDSTVKQLQNLGFDDSKIFAAIRYTKSLDVKAVAKRLFNPGTIPKYLTFL